MVEITFEKDCKLKWSEVPKYKDGGYFYKVVQCQPDGCDLVFKLSQTYKHNAVKKQFIRVHDWRSWTWNDVALCMIEIDVLTRHLHDALIDFYFSHRNECESSFLRSLKIDK